jgi:hypothetical protein
MRDDMNAPLLSGANSRPTWQAVRFVPAYPAGSAPSPQLKRNGPSRGKREQFSNPDISSFRICGTAVRVHDRPTWGVRLGYSA